VSKVVIVETWKQQAEVGIIQSFNVGITTIRMETILEPNIEVVRRGILIRFATNLGSGLGGVLARSNLSQSSMLLVTITKVVGILEMVSINSIMTIHWNRIANQPLMSSMVVGGCKSANVVHQEANIENQLL
jgi:hypothetical protein